eukprot:TRINITY_DN2495_c0_g1_i1.p1 TRINITY_DN2495_c0_g1~~TRINITY_DN2495_c0_g1_i1.p1  ORF type:complete len:138 (-),score=5.17 TRINITY_DN2495_c0_g1_i1:112-525(-)
MAPSGVGEAWAIEVDLANRDPNNINDHLQVAWEEIFAEPDQIHTIDCVWKYSAKCFTMWKTLCYIIATVICGIPIASCWGCFFACVAFQHIWDVTPSIKACAINCAITKKLYTICLDACLDPICTSCGKLFSAFSKS